MRGSLSRFRELPLQVGPSKLGGAAFCTRSWQIFSVQYSDPVPEIKPPCSNRDLRRTSVALAVVPFYICSLATPSHGSRLR
jgi:hypothetical protein